MWPLVRTTMSRRSSRSVQWKYVLWENTSTKPSGLLHTAMPEARRLTLSRLTAQGLAESMNDLRGFGLIYIHLNLAAQIKLFVKMLKPIHEICALCCVWKDVEKQGRPIGHVGKMYSESESWIFQGLPALEKVGKPISQTHAQAQKEGGKSNLQGAPFPHPLSGFLPLRRRRSEARWRPPWIWS